MQACKNSYLFLLSIMISLPATAAEKLIFSLDLMRHGDRAPIKAMPKAPYTRTIPLGQLSPEGIAQCYQLGTKFRQKYVVENHLLPESYDPKLMYVRSSDFDRTLMSAQSVLMGLYPLGTGPHLKDGSPAIPGGLQPIPIHTLPQHKDTFIPCEHKPKMIEYLRKKYVLSTPEWQKKHQEIAEHFSEWEAITGYKIQDLYSVGSLADTIHIYENHDVALPSALTPEHKKEILGLKTMIYLNTWQDYTSSATLGHPLLETITHYISDAAEQKTPLKYVLLSAHDCTIARTAGALRARLPEFPGYNAVLNFSLIEKDNQQYEIRLSYNDKPLFIPDCQGPICSLQQLSGILKKAKESADPACVCDV